MSCRTYKRCQFENRMVILIFKTSIHRKDVQYLILFCYTYSRFVNGKAVKTGHRFRKTHDFGYVALDILSSYAEDSGTYMCKATNLAGEAVNTCTIKVGCKHHKNT